MERTVLADQMKTFLNIGSAQIVEQSDTSEDSAARQSNFYAIAYDWDGETIISYRGTDDPLNDANTGYGLGAGAPDLVLKSPQNVYPTPIATSH